ncbi:diguanylate cyclase [Paraburkholderia sp. BL21I4N1]|uniref:GGDEF domain-containing protein n=1 Tax=Paraburkholderia sp. BL21I4N1 TaxID=1938801 RepID=UPI000CFD2C4A|nr:GGDEF domain-containing protein [Paraburkholderia sp. BL21I4N1]PQV46697.1 diguanylate cyclase (GGDEF)-like protein [Paraburkholderia sp. BL21I4N1]
MHVDLLTIYFLIVGTLLASSGMTLWEHRAHPRRSKELKILAAGYATLAIGCAAVTFRHELPGATGSALSNLVIVTGYLLVLQGVASLSGGEYRGRSVAMLIVLALTWAVAGARWEDSVWYYASAIPIALASGATSVELWKSDGMKSLPSRHIAVWVTGIHALLYAARACILPLLAARYGRDVVSIASSVTMYEGVLYSVVLPMTLLRLVREETHGELLRDSQTDYLTRLGNRRWFFEEGTRVIRDEASRRPISLLAFDLDLFKTINDRYGHKTGDEVLKAFGAIARRVAGPDAILARIGGEEFAALLPNQGALGAKDVGETIAKRFAEAIPHLIDGVAMEATVSVGLAQLGVEAPTLGDLLAAADTALYNAKSLGGNRLVLAPQAARSEVA